MIIKNLTQFINLLYIPFRRLIPVQIFRYLVCGSGNTILDAGLYHIIHVFVLKRNDIIFLDFHISSHIFAFLIVFPITFFSGFMLVKLIVFPGSALKGITQLIRFSITIISSLLIQYLSLKLFVEALLIYPTISKLLASAVAAVFTFLSHKYFSFKKSHASLK